MRAGKARLTALAVRECGKPWHDADAEICEAIDFIEYYARAAVELERGPKLPQVPGERNEIRYVPRGTVAVIAPWNFPVAISTGMVTAGLATGNSVLYKPAEQSPGCGFEVVRLLREAGVPKSALAFLPGGDTPGRALVRHPLVHTIAFTGSVAVGLEIARTAAEPAPGQDHLKRLVAEMGGKNCLIVDDDADLDEVIPAALDSAFGFAGQKCSAASRLVAVGGIADELLERLAGAVATIRVGQASKFGVDLGPVIDQESVERHAGCLALAEAEATVAARVTELPAEGWFCPPALVSDLPEGSPLSEEEIFAPLLTFERVPDLNSAIELVGRSKFALTGGLFSRNPEHIRAVEMASPVGNLYINRGITGAMVGRHPFGGNRLSGTGSKAGGPGYLEHFV
jgi:RHH-type proline utilization regulon transcriptional repressor/proline dehydrogenase/delta 1-pyrroline-5-carboxylate dehydrogenase